ncbi:MAG TPA: hypothetical protein VGB25_00360 [Candidatus Binatia bacterium]
MKIPIIIGVFGLAVLLGWAGLSAAQHAEHAEYTVLLKNGSRLTVKGYREEGDMLKVQGMGGEFGIPKDQIVSITKGASRTEKGLVVPDYSDYNPPPSQALDEGKEGGGPKAEAETEGQKPAAAGNGEEKEYRRKIRELTETLDGLQQRYSEAARGRTGPEPGLLQGEGAIQARTADLQSRLKDAQREAGTAASRVDAPLPSYTPQERELSDMRKEIIRLREERNALIQEMKRKNLTTEDLPPTE